MRGQENSVGLDAAFEHPTTCTRRRLGVNTKPAVPVGAIHLYCRVHAIARQQATFTLRFDPPDRVAGRVTGGQFQPDGVVDLDAVAAPQLYEITIQSSP